jgi:putrescine aminotransferase
MDRTELAKLDAAHVLHPHAVVGHPDEPIVFVRGRGAVLWDADGREYLDGTCGLWQCAVGHGRPELAEAAANQIRELEFYASFWNFANEPSIRLAERLAALAPAGLSTVFFTNGGSEGTETAFKLVRLAWHASGRPDRNVILSRKSAYHGMGVASLTATGIDTLRQGFEPLAPDFLHLSAPNPYELGPNATEFLVDELRRTIADIGPERIAAFIGEPVIGVGGAVPPPGGYWPAVRDELRKHGVLLIADEVITAYGRTGHWFASDRYDIQPDVIVTAKALTSGYFPMGAVLIGDRVMELLDGTAFRHGFTYNGHPVGAAVALANLDIIENEGLLARAAENGAYLLSRLKELEQLDCVGEVRGVGLMLGIELVGVDDAVPLAARIREGGVIVRGSGSKIVMSPPLVIERDQLDRMAEAIEAELSKL